MKNIVAKEVVKTITNETFDFNVDVNVYDNYHLEGGVVIQFDYVQDGINTTTMAAVTKHEFMRSYWEEVLARKLNRTVRMIKGEL